MDVVLLLFIFFFISANLAWFIFKEVTLSKGGFIDDYANFTNFGRALITLFRAATGEDWQGLMADLSYTGSDAPDFCTVG